MEGIGLPMACQIDTSCMLPLPRQVFTQSFERGVPVGTLQERKRPAGDSKKSGTTVRFLFDKDVFTPG